MKNSSMLPVIIGAATAGVIAWLLISEDTAEIRKELSEKFGNSLDFLKDKILESRAISHESTEGSTKPNSNV